MLVLLGAMTLAPVALADSSRSDTTASHYSQPGALHASVIPEGTYRRNLLIGNAAFGTATYFYMANTWGAPTGKFHFKNEFHDNIALTDEVSHFFAGYKLTQGFSWLFKSLGMDEQVAPKYSALQAAMLLTLVEVPLDAFNPTQGFGATDLVADYGGIGLALLKDKYPNNFDMKFSVKHPPWRFENKFLASDVEEFDNFIWWATYKPKYAWVGVGYSANHERIEVEPEFYVGIGTTAYDLLHVVAPGFADEVKFLDTYFINFHRRL